MKLSYLERNKIQLFTWTTVKWMSYARTNKGTFLFIESTDPVLRKITYFNWI